MVRELLTRASDQMLSMPVDASSFCFLLSRGASNEPMIQLMRRSHAAVHASYPKCVCTVVQSSTPPGDGISESQVWLTAGFLLIDMMLLRASQLLVRSIRRGFFNCSRPAVRRARFVSTRMSFAAVLARRRLFLDSSFSPSRIDRWHTKLVFSASHGSLLF